MKYLFLDIDGVLNTPTDFFELQKYGHDVNQLKGRQVINRGCLALLQQIIEYTSAKIVLSSTWKLQYSLDEIHNMFTNRGWTLPRETLHDTTPNLSNGTPSPILFRGEEIQIYLNNHPEIEKFLIIDDKEDTLTKDINVYKTSTDYVTYPSFIKSNVNILWSEDNINANFIHTNKYAGLTLLDMNRAIDILGPNKKYVDNRAKQVEYLNMFLYCIETNQDE